MTTLKEMILDTEDYALVRTGATSKESLRAAYEVALAGSAYDGPRESAEMMFARTGRFCDVYINTLQEIAEEFYVEVGLAGGAIPGTLADIAYLSAKDALKLENITFAQHQAEVIRRGLISEFNQWASNQKREVA